MALSGCSGISPAPSNLDSGGESQSQQPQGESSQAQAGDKDLIVVGYAQVGAESDWRTANTESFKSTFTEANNYQLIFNDAQQKQENQIKAIRDFIRQIVPAAFPFPGFFLFGNELEISPPGKSKGTGFMY